MKVCFLGNAQCIHVSRWANDLADEGIEIIIITNKINKNLRIKQYALKHQLIMPIRKNSFYRYAISIRTIKQVRSILSEEKPDFLHSFFSTHAGLLGALSGFRPFIVSVLGSDVCELKNPFLRYINKFVFRRADKILATGKYLAKETEKYTKKKIYITPFYVDTDLFRPLKVKKENKFIIGTVKNLRKYYGQASVIRALPKLTDKIPDIEYRLIGKGRYKETLVRTAKKLGVEKHIRFIGATYGKKLVREINKMNLFIMPSIRESFGVAALEAQACEIPVIASNIGGIPEVVCDKSLLFNIYDDSALPEIIYKVWRNMERYDNEHERNRRRSFVTRNFSKKDCLKTMIDIYN